MLDGWADFGLSRFSASRGLDELDRAKLVSVGRTPGRSPVVIFLDAGAVVEIRCQCIILARKDEPTPDYAWPPYPAALAFRFEVQGVAEKRQQRFPCA